MISALVTAGMEGGYLASSRLAKVHWQAGDRALPLPRATGVPVPHFTERYDGETLAHLEWCDDLLRRGLPGRSAPQQSDLERITALVTELERDLSEDPEIDPELHAFLLQHAQAMAQAVRDVPVRGTAGLEEALDQATGDFTSVGPIWPREQIRPGRRCSWR